MRTDVLAQLKEPWEHIGAMQAAAWRPVLRFLRNDCYIGPRRTFRCEYMSLRCNSQAQGFAVWEAQTQYQATGHSLGGAIANLFAHWPWLGE